MPKHVDVLFNASTPKNDLIQAWQQMPAASDGTAVSDSGEPLTPLGPVVHL